MTERNTFAHASVHAAGCMPAATMATRHAAVRRQVLAGHRNFDGTVYLIFQRPRRVRGAREMINDGCSSCSDGRDLRHAQLARDAVGQFALRSGASFASSNEFKITIRGKARSGDAHNGIDPVPVACQMCRRSDDHVRNKRRSTRR